MSTVAESVRRFSPNGLRIVATEPPESHFVGSVSLPAWIALRRIGSLPGVVQW